MTHYPYILFDKSPEQLRELGARGGRTSARNRRLRLLTEPPVPAAMAAVEEPEGETAAEAIAALDTQFPWLRGAEQRTAPRRSPRRADLARAS